MTISRSLSHHTSGKILYKIAIYNVFVFDRRWLFAGLRHVCREFTFVVAGRRIPADPERLAVTRRAAAADLRRSPPDDLREMTRRHREAGIRVVIRARLAGPHIDGRFRGNPAAPGQVLAVIAADRV